MFDVLLSDSIKGINYIDGVLEIEFEKSGDIYQYFPVVENVYKRFTLSLSKEIFYLTQIKGIYLEHKICGLS